MRFVNEMEEGEAAAWESLDDDNDDAVLRLRPCKRHQINLLSHNTSSSQPIVLSPSHSSTPPSLTLHSPHSQFQPTPPPSTSLRLIPGPAGAVKAAMLRRSRASYPNPRGAAGDDPPIPTQEYIRRAVEDGDLDDEDDDFKSNPWLCALQFLGPQGMLDGGISSTPLSSIKKCLDIGRADQVVAVIKSCTQNGLGDLMVTLKDPTGTVDASIHHKVIAKFEFGKEISVGSVLILQKVAVFAPSQSACYLNITLNNVVKVISKDSGPPPKQNNPVSAIKRVAAECGGEINNMHKAFSFELDRPEVFMDDNGQCSVRSSSAHNDKPTEKGNHPFPLGGHCSSSIANRRDQNEDLVVKEPTMTVRQDVAREILNKARRMDNNTIDDDDDVDKRKGWDDVNRLGKKRSNSLSNLQKDATPAEKLVGNGNDQESWRIINGVQKQRQSMMSRASLPQWTDEQLNELFGDNSEDHDSLF